jgi:parallel beta-helix repeat protein
MKRKNIIKLLILLIFIGISPSFAKEDDLITPKTQAVSIVHPKIYINGESALDAFPNKTGSGTEFDPYRISNLEIDAGAADSAVEIRGIFNRYLILEELTVQNSGTNNLEYDSGIELQNCRYVTVKNCNIKNNDQGMCIGWSSECKIYNNDFENNSGVGLYVHDTNQDILIVDNYFYNNRGGIDFDGGTKCEVIENEFVINYGVSIELSGTTYIEISGNEINPWENEGAIEIIDSSYITIQENDVRQNQKYFYGIRLWNSQHNTVSQNTVENTERGIWLEGSSYNDLLENELAMCNYGIYIELLSNDNVIKNNKFSDNIIDFFETNSSGNRLIDTTKIIIWVSIGVVIATGVVLSSIYLPKVYKKRFPIREKRKAERDLMKKEMRQIKIEEQKKQEEEKRRITEQQRHLHEKLQLEEASIAQEQVKRLEEMKRKGLVCIQCGKILPQENLKFCVFCGTPQRKIEKADTKSIQKPKDAEEKIETEEKGVLSQKSNTCPHCRRKLMDPNLKFCVYCGKPL